MSLDAVLILSLRAGPAPRPPKLLGAPPPA